MTGGLQPVDSGGAPPRCVFCGRPAAGPCASCRRMVCGHCCTLTEGGMKPWAICLDCDRKGGRSLRGAWASFLGWLLLPILALAAATVLLAWLTRSCNP